jgi:hypothetical protein
LIMVASLGFEPRQTESESVVLPLHYEAMQFSFKRALIIIKISV